MIEINDHGMQISEDDIVLLEEELGIKLPDVYRQFLLLHNGGIPTPDIIDVANAPGSPTDVQVFFGIGRSIESSDLFWNLHLISDRYPSRKLLPIACDSGGNLFCLAASKRGMGEVLYYDMSDSVGAFYQVAPDFSTFLNKIRSWN